MLKIGIIWFRDIRKTSPSKNYDGPPLATPTTQYHGIMEYMRFYENARLGFCYCITMSYIFCFRIHWNRPNRPILSISNLRKKSARNYDAGLRFLILYENIVFMETLLQGSKMLWKNTNGNWHLYIFQYYLDFLKIYVYNLFC